MHWCLDLGPTSSQISQARIATFHSYLVFIICDFHNNAIEPHSFSLRFYILSSILFRSMLRHILHPRRLVQIGSLIRSSWPQPLTSQWSGRRLPPRHFVAACTKRSYNSSSFPAVVDTIYALSTAQGRAAIAVVRISGPSCLEVSQPL